MLRHPLLVCLLIGCSAPDGRSAPTSPSTSTTPTTTTATTTSTSTSTTTTSDTGSTSGVGCVDRIGTWDRIELDPNGPYTQYDVAHTPDGDGLWITWVTNVPNPGLEDDPAVMGGRMDCNGTWTVGPSLIGGKAGESHTAPTVAAGAQGALFAWQAVHRRGGFAIFTDLFHGMVDRAGTVITAPGRLFVDKDGSLFEGESQQPTVLALSSGDFALVASWDDDDLGARPIFQVDLDVAGLPIADAQSILPAAGSYQNTADVAETVPRTLAWWEADFAAPHTAVTTQGAATAEEIPSIDFDIAAASDGLWLAWSTAASPSIHVRPPTGTEVLPSPGGVFEDEPSIGVGDDRVAVVWIRHGATFGQQSLRLASFDRSGLLLGEQDLLTENGGRGGAVEVSHVGQNVFFVAWEHGPSGATRAYGQFVDLN